MNYGAEGSDEFNKGYEHCQEVMKQRAKTAKFFATQTLTITYGKEIEAADREEALSKACDVAGDLDQWKEVDCESGDSVYIDEVWEKSGG